MNPPSSKNTLEHPLKKSGNEINVSCKSSNYSEDNLSSRKNTPQRSSKTFGNNESSHCSQEGSTLSEETRKEEMMRREEREFPNVFYDPVTKKLLQDPVVIPDGDAYERSVIKALGNFLAEVLYTNRALASIIEDRIQRRDKFVRSSIHSLKKSLRQLIEKSPIPSASYRPLHDSFYCPITFLLMYEPMVDPDIVGDVSAERIGD